MKKIILSIAFLGLFSFANANLEGEKSNESSPAATTTVCLTGQVVDINSGEALTGVEVSIEGTNIKAYTDFDGNFEIKDVKPGEYNLIASYISYKNSLVENFKADTKESKVDIKLQEEK